MRLTILNKVDRIILSTERKYENKGIRERDIDKDHDPDAGAGTGTATSTCTSMCACIGTCTGICAEHGVEFARSTF